MHNVSLTTMGVETLTFCMEAMKLDKMQAS